MKSFRNVVAIGAAVMFSFVGVANAAQLIVFEQPLTRWNEEVRAEFAVNRELGRAWVDVGLTTADLGEGRRKRWSSPRPSRVCITTQRGNRCSIGRVAKSLSAPKTPSFFLRRT